MLGKTHGSRSLISLSVRGLTHLLSPGEAGDNNENHRWCVVFRAAELGLLTSGLTLL